MDNQLTSIHVRRAVSGDPESLTWLVERFGGMLKAHARFRLQRGLQGVVGEEDLVQEVWLRTLPKLQHIETGDGRVTPVLIRFLGKTLVNICFEQRKRARRGTEDLPEQVAEPGVAGVVTRALGDEAVGLILDEVEALDPEDQEVVMLRLLEGVPNALVAQKLKISESAASRRYSRVMDRLRKRLPGSFFEDLA